MTPPPDGPRDWSPTIEDVDVQQRVRPGMRPIRGAGHIEGLRWARFLAWAALLIGSASIVLALVVPLAGNHFRILWVVPFGGGAIWCGLMAEPRFRSVRGRGSGVSKLGVAFGAATIAIAIYAFAVIVLSGQGSQIPAPAHWSAPDAGASAGVPSQTTSVSGAPSTPDVATAPKSPVEAERLALAQTVGTAVHVLEQTRTGDGTWPAYLAFTTDLTGLITPDGITLALLPVGAQVLYSTSSDLREFSLTVTGALGTMAAYESAVGTIASSVPDTETPQ